MKRQTRTIAVILTAIAFTSCSKEWNEEKTATSSPQKEAVADQGKPGVLPGGLNKNLEGLYKFDGNLKDHTGQLPEAVASTSGADLYTDDRNGVPNSAIKFNGRYGLNLYELPTQNNMSVAAWVKYDSANASLFPFVNGQLGFMQENDHYLGYVSTPMTTGITSGPIDDHWHQLVSTYDGNQVSFYIDGTLVGSHLNPTNFPSGNGGSTYWIAWLVSPDMFWHGSMDDFRFYSKTLSAQEVQKLYQLQ